MKRFISCAVTFCLAFSMMGIPSLAFAKDVLADDSAKEFIQNDAADGQDDAVLIPSGDDESSEDAPYGESVADLLAPQDAVLGDGVTEAEDGDVVFFSAQDIATQAEDDGFKSKGSQISGSQVSVKLRSQIHPHSSNLTADYGVKAYLVNSSGTISTAEFKPATSVAYIEDDENSVQVIGDYVAKFPIRIPAGEYMLKVSGGNYLAHDDTDLVVEDGNNISVELVDMVNVSSVSGSVSSTVENSQNIQGLLPYGDFNHDGRIDNKDVAMMAAALSNNTNSENVNAYDINADGVFNLLDMQYFATTLKDGQDTSFTNDELIKVIHGRHVITKDVSQTKINSSNNDLKIGGANAGLASGDGDDKNVDPEYLDALLREALFESSDLSVILEQDKAITKDHPVSIEISTPAAAEEDGSDNDTIIEMKGMAIRPPSTTKSAHSDGKVNAPLSGSVTVVDEDGKEFEFDFEDGVQVGKTKGYSLIDKILRSNSEEALALSDADTIVIDFGQRIAIKKITIKVTETTSPDATLAEIGRVEFLNDMADKIDPPNLSVPTNLNGEPGTKQIVFTWSPQQNITGYEIRITDPSGKTTTNSTVFTTYTIADKKLSSGFYKAAVRSTNGEWKSPWSDEISIELVPTQPPNKPTGINITPGFGELVVSWPAVDDAAYYTLYYKEKSAANYELVNNITSTRYTLSHLKENTEYILYLTATNGRGTSPNSEERSGTTMGKDAIQVKVPWYNLINRAAQYDTGIDFEQPDESLNYHITNITASGPNDDAINPGFEPIWMVDGDYTTGYYPKRASTYYDGATVTFDGAYDMNTMIITSSLLNDYKYTTVHEINVYVTDENGTRTKYSNLNGDVKVTALGSAAPGTFKVKFPRTKATQIQFGSLRAYAAKVAVSEIAFYRYDELYDRIDELWEDDLCTVLKKQVNGKTIDEQYLKELEDQLGAVDPATVKVGDPTSGEPSPDADILLASINAAREVLKFAQAPEPARIYASIDDTTNAHVGGLNAWQPLGVAVRAGDHIQVYVGGRANAGSDPILSGSTSLYLGYGQIAAETKDVFYDKIEERKLNYGSNEFVIPANGSTLAKVEKGGQLYVRANEVTNKNMEFNIRVLNGIEISSLNLYKVTDEAAYRKACEDYVDELVDQVAALKTTHEDRGHEEEYGNENCVANTTDIMLDSIMFSVPASQVLKSLGDGDRNSRVEKLITSTKSSSEMMDLFWQHKGLGKMTTDEQKKYGGKNGIPAGHLNLRYMRTNPGVFMYAAGNHVGIQYDSCTIAGSPGVTKSEDGEYQGGNYFGWGIAHEIGHQINQQQYTYAEVTNNYYAQLSLAQDSNGSVRWTYPALYDRVTSGVKGAPTDAVGIGFYWQLHLAYDNGYNYKLYDNYTDIYNNLIMARIDSIARNPEMAPGSGFTLDGADKDNAFMRLACAAAGDAATGYGRDILDYFIAWGQTPDATTIQYASQFDEDNRLLQYINDDARVYRIKGGQSVAKDRTVTAKLYSGNTVDAGKEITEATEYKDRKLNTRQVTLEMKIESKGSANATDGIIGFEVLRNGQAVAFKMLNEDGKNAKDTITYTDTIATENNRTYVYEVRAVDNLLNTTNTVTFPEIKIADKNAYRDKSRWDANTNMVSSDDEAEDSVGTPGVDNNDASPCEGAQLKVKAVSKVIDNKADTVYQGSLPTGNDIPTNSAGEYIELSDPYIEIDFGSTLQITGITVPDDDSNEIDGAAIKVFDGSDWTTLTKGTSKSENNETTYYFDGVNTEENPYQLQIYTASKLRIVAPAGTSEMSLHEIDVLGPVGDNVDFFDMNGWVGYIDKDTKYADEPEGHEGIYTIPANSLVFIGEYSGDTAYNALKLYKINENGEKEFILGEQSQVLFAARPGEDAKLGKTMDGRWIYYFTPYNELDVSWSLPEKVMVELYRVDDAYTMEGERLVSNTFIKSLPSDIPTISLKIGGFTDGEFAPLVSE